MKKGLITLAMAAVCLGGGRVVPASQLEAPKAEYDQAMHLTPNLENGRRIFLTCAVCHRPEGWGTEDGTYPQIAGQWPSVIVKQLADIRARHRDTAIMYPFAVPRILGGAQEIADVAAYVAGLPMTPHNGRGPGDDLASGERLYLTHCVTCHGRRGRGEATRHIPALGGQHYQYLVRELERIKLGTRRNADPEMRRTILKFTNQDMRALADYLSRLLPARDKLAGSPDWTNPDFPNYVRPSTSMESIELPNR